ncbi:MAG: hypothetical protein Q9M15_09815 [Mariprofundaceae bacterium]|nr:hypothetical protein [Mariprofundaceae bacterium]
MYGALDQHLHSSHKCHLHFYIFLASCCNDGRTQSISATAIEVKLDSATVKDVEQGFAYVLNRIDAQKRLSMTYDQGREMAWHELLAAETGLNNHQLKLVGLYYGLKDLIRVD